MSGYGFRIITLSVAIVLGLATYSATGDAGAVNASQPPDKACWF